MSWEENLVRQAARGDRDAFGSLAEKCRPWLLGLCLRLVRDRAAAEDLAQEALLRAFRDLGQLREPGRFRAWLSRIAVNACRMHLRRQLARPVEIAGPCQPAPDGPETSDAPLGVDEALAHLDADARRLLLLFYGEGMSHQELADALALSSQAVKSRLHRAREKLRKEMLARMTEEQKVRLGVPEAQPGARRTVLLVEPDAELCERLREALAGAGYQVLVLPTGEAALAAINDRRGQLLVLDKQCVEPNWIELLTLLMLDAWTPEHVKHGVGVIVDPGNERDVFLAWQAGADFILTRPPLPEEVVTYVKRLEELLPG